MNPVGFFNATPSAHIIEIRSDASRTLLTIERTNGQFVAKYDPADLDEAARIFVERVNKMLGPTGA